VHRDEPIEHNILYTHIICSERKNTQIGRVLMMRVFMNSENHEVLLGIFFNRLYMCNFFLIQQKNEQLTQFSSHTHVYI